jgi:hypothetical protein
VVKYYTFRARQVGVTYFWTLLILTFITLGLGKLMDDVRMSNQRARERELLYVGNLYRQAVRQYWQSAPIGAKRYPDKLDDLLRDPRYPVTRRYLRRLYLDPVTGKPFVPVVSPGGGVMGVHSASPHKPVKISGFSGEEAVFTKSASYQNWEFIYAP